MGGNSPGFYNNGGTRTPNVITARQEGLLNELRDILGREIANEDPAIALLKKRLLSDTSEESKAMSERIFSEGLLQPALRNFDQEIAPRINSGFARYGGSLSSRRGDALSGALSGVFSNVQAAHAQMLPTIQSFPLTQTLAQIQGLAGINTERLRPFALALGLATSPTKGVTQEDPGVGWQITGDLIKTAVTAVAASDRRLKQDTEHLGDGRWSFRYTPEAINLGYGGPGRWIGYMAQDLLAEDVRRDEKGYLCVTNPKYFPIKMED